MPPTQTDLFAAPPRTPSGFRYAPDLISPEAEARLLAAFDPLPFKAFEFHGFTGRRRIVSFGSRYDYAGQTLRPAEPPPAFLEPLLGQAARFGGVAPAAIAHVMVTDYPPGAPIGWHRDRPEFDKIIGVSLLAPAPLRFRRRTAAGFERAVQQLEPRSAYLIDGDARQVWEHSIAPLETRRVSVTFRTLR
jgi:alkylated DNA repair dioxygenase AlkB